MLDPQALNPDGQPPLPLPAAEGYARTAMDWAHEPLPAGVVAHLDQPYGPQRLMRCDAYAPAGAQRAPMLVFWHGGGFTNGYRAWVRFMAGPVTALGLVLVAPSYRLAPDCPLPDALDDANTLLAALPRLASAWGGDATHLFLAGHSAGGHIAALTALRRAERTGAGVAADAVRGCLPVSGVLDLHHPAPVPGSLEERVYTMALRGRDPMLDTVLSPLYWAAGNTVPFLLTLGEHDSPRVLQSNRRMLALLQAQPAPAACHLEPGRDHFSTHTALRDPADRWYAALAAMVAGQPPA